MHLRFFCFVICDSGVLFVSCRGVDTGGGAKWTENRDAQNMRAFPGLCLVFVHLCHRWDFHDVNNPIRQSRNDLLNSRASACFSSCSYPSSLHSFPDLLRFHVHRQRIPVDFQWTCSRRPNTRHPPGVEVNPIFASCLMDF
jgi:hypothetical protein